MDFREFDLHLTDGDLEDFLSYYDKTEEGVLIPDPAQHPIAALKSAENSGSMSLQLQPYSNSSPEHSPERIGHSDSKNSSHDNTIPAMIPTSAPSQDNTGSGHSGNSKECARAAAAATSRPPQPPRSASGRPLRCAALPAGSVKLESLHTNVDSLAATLAASLAQECSAERPTSHSTVEKQRRDRLNNLLEDLGEMVPPREAKYAVDGAASVRRPKHVVLTDAIELLQSLRQKLSTEEQQTQALRDQVEELQRAHKEVTEAAAAARDAPAKPAAAEGPASRMLEGGQGAVGAAPPAELPQAPQTAPLAMGVVVERGKSSLYVKISCRDRKGLLSDIVGALRALPLVVLTAAITTTDDGRVHDVFEVAPQEAAAAGEEGMCGEEDIQLALMEALYSGAARDRRKRSRPCTEGEAE